MAEMVFRVLKYMVCSLVLGSLASPVASVELTARTITNTRKLQATWTFSCPVGGSTSRVMKWQASVNDAHNHVTLKDIYNIDGFDHIVFTKGDFTGAFYHGYCKDIGTQTCIYHLIGRTTGSVDATGIHLSMVGMTNQGYEGPHVTEECIETGPGLHTGKCPQSKGKQRVCEVTNTDAQPIP